MTTNPSPETVAAMARAIERAFHSYTFASAEESDPDILDAIATWRGDKDVGPAIEHLQTVCAFAAHDALAALAAAPPSAGEGWVMVPRVPTREMWAAMGDAQMGLLIPAHHDVVSEKVWNAAVAAAPSPPAEEAK